MKISIKENSSAKWEMFGEIDSHLGEIFFIICQYLEQMGVKEIIITSMIRPQIQGHDSGIHSLGRAIDISDKTIPTETGKTLMDHINSNFPYDIQRPKLDTIIYHTGTGYAGDKAAHYHLQVRGRDEGIA